MIDKTLVGHSKLLKTSEVYRGPHLMSHYAQESHSISPDPALSPQNNPYGSISMTGGTMANTSANNSMQFTKAQSGPFDQPNHLAGLDRLLDIEE
jgi:hypothetical protein